MLCEQWKFYTFPMILLPHFHFRLPRSGTTDPDTLAITYAEAKSYGFVERQNLPISMQPAVSIYTDRVGGQTTCSVCNIEKVLTSTTMTLHDFAPRPLFADL